MMSLDDEDEHDYEGIELGTLREGARRVPESEDDHAAHLVLSVDGIWAHMGEWGLFHQSVLFVVFLASGVFCAFRVMVQVYLHRDMTELISCDADRCVPHGDGSLLADLCDAPRD